MIFEQIEQIVCDHFGLTLNEINMDDKRRRVTDAKHFLWYILYAIMGYGQKEISARYGVSKRNFFYSVSIIGEGIKMQPFYANHYYAIMDRIKELDIL